MISEDFPPVDICLATYNGEIWLDAFLDSIKSQTYPSWRLIVSDDGSTDETLTKIRCAFDGYQDRLFVITRRAHGCGIVQNFSDALAASTADYVFLADQDDVWLPQKLMNLFLSLKKLEGDEKFPSVVYSDLEVVDRDLRPLADSWWRYSEMPSAWGLSLKNLLMQNSVPGCSMVVNRKLLDIALPIPEQAIMHDWWIVLVGAAVGRVAYDGQKTIRYRRHESAATYHDKGGVIAAFRRFVFERGALRSSYAETVLQARQLLTRLSPLLPPRTLRSLQAYVDTEEYGWLRRRWVLARNRFVKPTLRGTVRFYFWV